uniref:Ig-like domain-containing protein n=1 Tax=Poecilia latipinna TaxID=48699 RepID=A0A3B3TS53_9TELE
MQTVKPTVILQPNWPQIYIGEKVTLKCEIQDGRFYYGTKQWRKNNSVKPGRSQEYMIISASESDSGDYSCRAEGDRFSLSVWSDVFTLVVYINNIILLSPVHPVTEGDPVTLSCRDKTQQLLSNVFFYHNDKLLHNDSREELKISAVSKSDEGFYKCQHSGKDSPRSWMSIIFSFPDRRSPAAADSVFYSETRSG